MQKILITGANRGLGLEFTRQYAAEGWHIIACCRSPESADELKTLAAGNSNIIIEKLDVADFAAIDQLGIKYKETPIDILLNNAGIIGPIPIDENITRQHFGQMEYDIWEDVMRVNCYAPMKLTETFMDNVAASDQKKIICISSSVGSISEMNIPGVAYASSKTALNRAMTIAARELKPKGVIVGLFCPGYVKTRMDAFGYAMVEIEESISLLRPMIEALTLEDSGSFRGHDGRIIGW
ncbi:MAG: SDR family oxidoreductase [Chromatiales bacterium]|jgi:NAD(P)-dependent dehydrogenase (short-subunit alcohol dehydrogenase family)|nr:SDR family oxidoreductase [Chromatiales bacterium]